MNPESEPRSETFLVEGMTCASCVSRVEKTLKKIDGVDQASVNLATNTARVHFDPLRVTPVMLKSALNQAGYILSLPEPDSDRGIRDLHAEEASRLRSDLIRAAFFSIPVMVLSMGAMDSSFLEAIGMSMGVLNLVLMFLTIPVLLFPGRRFFLGFWAALRHGTADMNTLVAVGTGIAFGYSAFAVLFPDLVSPHASHSAVYFDTTTSIITLILFGRWLEARAKTRASQALRSLLVLQPETALLLHGTEEVEIPASQLQSGALVVVRPGLRFPADGEISTGETSVDESMLTGESLPVDLGPGMKVTGGTVNLTGTVVIRTTEVGADSMLSRIVRLVEQAQGSKAPIQSLADRIASVFVPVVILLALATTLSWYFSGSAQFLPSLLHGIAVLVIACPCALGLATPAAIMVGIGAGARSGILIKDAESLERAREISIVVFDKTGTLTQGRPTITDLFLFDASLDELSLLSMMAAAEYGSAHPFASAIRDEALSRGVEPRSEPTSVQVAGAGVTAKVDGHLVVIGNEGFLAETGIDVGPAAPLANSWSSSGKTVLFVAIDHRLAAICGVADQPRAEAEEAVKELHELGIRTVMLTGDQEITARAIAARLGVDTVIARVKPEEKAREIQRLQKEGRVAMVGDGINDAPALATADVGIALSTGTAVAMDTADITLMHGDPRGVARALRLSRRTVRTIRQNLFWAFIYNVVGIPVAALGFLDPMFAAAAMAFSSVSVVGNSLRLRSASRS